MQVFHRKCLKGFLHLSQTAPTPSIHFLFGELPIEAKIHRDMFSLFYSIWTNPSSKIFSIVKYLLETSSENSRSWSIQLRHISKMYNMDDPLTCLTKTPPSKSSYKEYILTKITAFHEHELRTESVDKDKMKYLNVSLIGLRGKLHPAISGVSTTHAVNKMRPHIKMLVGNYLTFEEKSLQSGGSPYCRLCSEKSEYESLEHLISRCVKFSDIRTKISNQMRNIIKESRLDLDPTTFPDDKFTQFLLDPSSLNLERRVSINHPILPRLYQLSRDFCYFIDKSRTEFLAGSKGPAP